MGEIKIKANSAQVELELGVSLAMNYVQTKLSKKTSEDFESFDWNSFQDKCEKDYIFRL